jgi:hypothetical protein
MLSLLRRLKTLLFISAKLLDTSKALLWATIQVDNVIAWANKMKEWRRVKNRQGEQRESWLLCSLLFHGYYMWEMIKVADGRKLENEIVWLFYWRALLILDIFILLLCCFTRWTQPYIYTPQGCYPTRNEWPTVYVAPAVRQVRKD